MEDKSCIQTIFFSSSQFICVLRKEQLQVGKTTNHIEIKQRILLSECIDPICQTCSIDPAICEVCDNSIGYLNGDSCTACLDHQFGNDQQLQCQSCHQSCKNCIGELINQCKSCTSPLVLSTEYYCCHSSCLTCNGQLINECKTCQSPLIKSTENYCCHSSCKTCTDIQINQCSSCEEPLVKSSENHCCHNSCQTCTGPEINSCKTCQLPLIISLENYCCHETCKTCFGIEINQCKSCTSPLMKSSENYCCHQSCLTCNGPLINQCTSCSNPLVKSSENYCCNINCETCSGPELNQCKTCIDPTFLTSNNYCCLKSCDTCLGECCHDSCNSCSGSKQNQCLSCTSSLILSSENQCCHDQCKTCSGILINECSSCQSPQYVLSSEHTCCHFSCKTCNGNQINQCKTCNNPNILSTENYCCHQSCKICSGDLINQCTDCTAPLVLSSENYCCHQSCLTCSGILQNECRSCQSTLFLSQENQCCHQDCQTCSGIAINECNSCLNPLVLSSENTCCHSSCQTCTGSLWNQCKSCTAPLILSPDHTCCHSTCETCSDIQINKCKTCTIPLVLSSENYCCHQSCQTCQGNLINQCVSCQSPNFLSSENHCCHETCKLCSGPLINNCKQCTAPLVLSPLMQCCHSSCLTCSGPLINQCSACNGELVLSSEFQCCHASCLTCSGTEINQCLNCPISYTLSVDNYCCHYTCKTCIGNSINECTSCEAPLILSSENYCCHDTCKTCFGPLINNCASCDLLVSYFMPSTKMCIFCEEFRFGNNTIIGCMDCHPSCKGCTGSNANQCKNCDNQLYFYNTTNSTCDTCPAQHYGNNTDQTCNPCHPTCQKCIGPLETNCTHCNITTHYLNQSAHSCLACNIKYYGNDTEQGCAICPLNCLYCIGSQISDCLVCDKIISYKNISTNECMPCQAYYYGEDSAQTCLQCHYTCKTCDGPNYDQCLSCDPTIQYYSQSDHMCYPCEPQHYGNDTELQCFHCHELCLECYGPDNGNCTQCNNVTSYLDPRINFCVFCEEKYFGSLDELSCLPCHESCLRCSGQEQNQCISCDKSKYYLNSSDHLCYTCPLRKYGHDASKTCQPCDDTCLTCDGAGQTNCKSCNSSFQYLSKDTSECVRCPYKTYGNDALATCLPCLTICDICNGPMIENCLMCNKTSFFNISEGLCQACPPGFYGDNTTQSCPSCNETCLTCINGQANGCTSCDPENSFLNSSYHCQRCLPSYYGDSEIKECKKCNPECKSCVGDLSNQCRSCRVDAHINSTTYRCDLCVKGTFGSDEEEACIPCFFTCTACIGPSYSDCTECHPHDYLKIALGECLQCPAGLYGSNELQTCLFCHISCLDCLGGVTNKDCLACQPINYYYNDSLKSCLDCYSSCNSCDGGGESNCLSCIIKYLFVPKLRQCVQSCPQHYYSNKVNLPKDSQGKSEIVQGCLPCHETCAECNYYTENDCLSCPSNRFQYLIKQCILQCPVQHYFQNNATMICEECYCDCLTCKGTGKFDCLLCQAPNVYNLNGECLDQCPQFHYYPIFDFEKSTCQLCHTTCLKCQGGNTIDKCTLCAFPRLFLDSYCLDKCPEEHYFPDLSQNLCLQCHKTCLTCINQYENKCLTCPQNSLFFENRCYPQLCQPGFYSIISSDDQIQCIACSNLCQQCESENSHSCFNCFPNSYELDRDCYEQCPEQYYGLEILGQEKKLVCINCHYNCKTCKGPMNNDCTSCQNDKFLVANSTCEYLCPEYTYPDKEHGACSSCINLCKICGDGDACLICSDGALKLDNHCLENCPNQYFPQMSDLTCRKCNSSCLDCFDFSDSSCTSCRDNLVLANYQCVQQCPNGYFSSGKGICSACNYKCSTCYGPNDSECLTCKSAYFKLNTYCLAECAAGFFQDSQTKICGKCYQGCHTCSDITQYSCTRCLRGWWFYNLMCRTNCPDFFFQDNQTNECSKCFYRCRLCRGSNNDQCLACADGFVLSLDGHCNQECPIKEWLPQGIYINLYPSQVCQACDMTCATCNGPTENNCTTCYSTDENQDLEQRFLLNNTCIEGDCPFGLFNNKVLMICQACDDRCSECFNNGPNNCNACNNGSYLYITSCSDTCPDGLWQNKQLNLCSLCSDNCLTCSVNEQNCTSCNAGLFLYNYLCLKQCPLTFYQDVSKSVCSPCAEGCEICTGKEANLCQSCIIQYLLQQGNCLKSCNNGQLAHQLGRICLDTCPGGTFQQLNNCLPCHQTCRTCQNNELNSSCISCNKGQFLLKGFCVEKCEENFYYPDNSLQLCSSCHITCLACYGPYSSNCLSCQKPLYLFQAQCYSKCPDGLTGQIGSQSNNCQTCHKNCLTCTGITENECLLCNSNYYKGVGSSTCYQECPSKYFTNILSFQCEKCPENCLKCNGPNTNQCLACSAPYVLQPQQQQNGGGMICQIQCNQGYFPFKDATTKLCTMCHVTCLTCLESGSGDCTSCKDPYYLVYGDNQVMKVKGSCVLQCKSGYYESAHPMVCQLCDASCLECYGPQAKQCTACNDELEFAEGFCIDRRIKDDQGKTLQQLLYYEIIKGRVILQSCFSQFCRNCVGTLQNQCRECIKGYLLQEGDCVEKCDKDYMNNQLDQICERFMTSTSGCSHDYGDGFCKVCKSSSYLFIQTCVYSCPTNFWPDSSISDNQVCKKCHPYCSKCYGPLQIQCSECNKNIYLNPYTNTCERFCQNGFYKNRTDYTCMNCAKNCISCTGPGANQCLACQLSIGYFFLQDQTGLSTTGNCTQNCPGQTYKETTTFVCQKCSLACATCSGPLSSDCLSCNSPTFLYSGTCILKCPVGLFLPISSTEAKCQRCNVNFCAECQDTAITCTVCINGLFLMDHNCLKQCPDSFYNNLLSSICSTCHLVCLTCNGPTAQHCLTCKENTYFYQGACTIKCPDKYYQKVIDRTCSPCHSTCQNCFGPEKTECTECPSNLLFWEFICYPECPSETYRDGKTGQCQACSTQCRECFGDQANQCLNCQQGYYLDQIMSTCVLFCPSGFFQNSEKFTCDKCSRFCITCFNQADQCLLCVGNRTNEPTCKCPEGTWLQAPSKVCPPCQYNCKSCLTSQYTCNECIHNRVQAPSCICPEGFYDDGLGNAECKHCILQCKTCVTSAEICLTCQGDRITSKCICQPGKYDDNMSIMCQNCIFRCEECVERNNKCTKCRGNRILNTTTNDCLCPFGLWEDNQSNNCPKCAHHCESCINFDQCLTCRTIFDRLPPPSCACFSGFYTDLNFQECKACRPMCETCSNYFVCTKCAANRLGPFEGNCPCPEGSVNREYLKTPWCGIDRVAVPDIRFSEYLDEIIVDYGNNVTIDGMQSKFLPTSDLCISLVKEASLLKLGDLKPLCYIDKSNQSRVIIQLKEISRISPGEELALNLGQFRYTNSTNKFTFFAVQTVQPPNEFILPSIDLNGPPQNVTLCQKISIKITNQQVNAKRDLEVLKWEMIDIQLMQDDDLKQKLQHILNEASDLRSIELIIPSLTLQEYTTYSFKVTFQNIFQKQGSKIYSFDTSSYDSPIIEIQKEPPLIFQTQDRIVITASAMHLKCSLEAGIYEVKDQIKIIWNQQIQGQNNDGEQQNDLFSPGLTMIKGENDSSVQLEIEPFTAQGNKEYLITALAIIDLNGTEFSSQSEAKISVIPSPLFVYIYGGNRMVGFSVPVEILADARDPDVKGISNQRKNISCQWQCVNLNVGGDCKTMAGENLNISQHNGLSINILQKRMQPYNAFEFTISCIKMLDATNSTNKSNDATAIIMITELDLPQLAVDLPPTITSELTNVNQEVFINMTYPLASPDKLFYSCALIYDFNVVATVVFKFLQFRLKFWNHFSQYTDVSNMMIRVSVYNPRFFMPSSTSIKFNLNLPPKNCKILATRFSGVEYITQFNIAVQDCYDEHQPLQYQFSYYLGYEAFQNDIVNSTTLNQNYLNDFASENAITTALPAGIVLLSNYSSVALNKYLNKSVIVVMASIMDSLGSITNLTSYFLVTPHKQLSLQTLSEQWLIFSSTAISEASYFNLITPKLVQMIDDDSQEMKDFKKFAYYKLKYLRESLSSKILQEQCQKSIKLLSDEVTKYLDFSELEGIYNDTDSFLLQQQQINQNIQSQFALQATTPSEQRTKDSVFKNFQRTASILDAQLQAGSSKKEKLLPTIPANLLEYKLIPNTTLLFINKQITSSNQQIKNRNKEKQQTLFKTIQMNKNILGGIQSNKMTNEGDTIVASTGSAVSASKVTLANLQDQISPKSVYLNSEFSTQDQDNDSNNTTNNETNNNTSKILRRNLVDGDESSDSTVNQDELKQYELSVTKYDAEKANPYADNDFPYDNSTLPVYDASLKADEQDYMPNGQQAAFGFDINNLINELTAQTNINDTTKNSTQQKQDNINQMVCIQLNQTGQWSNQACKSVPTENGDGTLSFKCQCTSISVTSLIHDASGLFKQLTNNLSKALSKEALMAIISGKMLKSALFYVIIVQTVIYLFLLIWSYGQDINDEGFKKAKVSKELVYAQKDLLKLITKDKQRQSIIVKKDLESDEEKDKKNKTQQTKSVKQYKESVKKQTTYTLEDPKVNIIEDLKINKQDNNELISKKSKEDIFKQKCNIEKCSKDNQFENPNSSDILIEKRDNEIIKNEDILIGNLDQQQLQSTEKQDIGHYSQKMLNSSYNNKFSLRIQSEFIQKPSSTQKQKDIQEDQIGEEKIPLKKEKRSKSEIIKLIKQTKQQSESKIMIDENYKYQKYKDVLEVVVDLDNYYKQQDALKAQINAQSQNKERKWPFIFSHYLVLLKRTHKFLSLIYQYDKQISRPVRITLFYLQLLVILTLNLLVSPDTSGGNFYIVIVFSVFTAVINGIIMTVITLLLKSKLILLKLIGVIISGGFIGVCTFVLVAWCALQDFVVLNRWCRDYLIQLFQDLIVNQQITTLLQYYSILYVNAFSETGGKLYKLIKQFLYDKASNNLLAQDYIIQYYIKIFLFSIIQ